ADPARCERFDDRRVRGPRGSGRKPGGITARNRVGPSAAVATSRYPAAPMSAPNQFRLLGQRRFLPFFGAQALGAFNDNVYRNVLVILITFGGTIQTGMPAEVLTNLAGGLFILPYLLFSGVAGQIADRFDKS